MFSIWGRKNNIDGFKIYLKFYNFKIKIYKILVKYLFFMIYVILLK